MTTHKDLIVWQKAMNFVLAIYKATKLFPNEDRKSTRLNSSH